MNQICCGYLKRYPSRISSCRYQSCFWSLISFIPHYIGHCTLKLFTVIFTNIIIHKRHPVEPMTMRSMSIRLNIFWENTIICGQPFCVAAFLDSRFMCWGYSCFFLSVESWQDGIIRAMTLWRPCLAILCMIPRPTTCIIASHKAIMDNIPCFGIMFLELTGKCTV